MSMTPSKRRREGRRAFDPNCSPNDFCPYYTTTWNWEAKRLDWLEGWEQARIQHIKDLLEQAKEEITNG